MLDNFSMRHEFALYIFWVIQCENAKEELYDSGGYFRYRIRGKFRHTISDGITDEFKDIIM